MKAEEAVEVNRAQIGFGLVVVRARNAEGGALGIVRIVAVRHDDVEAVGGAAQEDDDEGVAARRGVPGRKRESWHPRWPGDGSGEHGGGFKKFAAGEDVGHGGFLMSQTTNVKRV